MEDSNPKPVVRLAKPNEFDKIAVLARKAFIQDPVFNYMGSHKQLLKTDVYSAELQSLEVFYKFLLLSCYKIGGRITVAVKPISGETSKETEETIVAAAYWCPPNKRLAIWKIPTLLQSGVTKVLKRWGLPALMRLGFEYLDVSHAAVVEGYKAKGVKESPDASWYLQLVMTDPAFQGQGMMSLLVREAFANALPGSRFTLEATTAASRDRYLRLGFEQVKIMNLGKGKVDSMGIPASGKAAVGVECYSMVNWNPMEKTNPLKT